MCRLTLSSRRAAPRRPHPRSPRADQGEAARAGSTGMPETVASYGPPAGSFAKRPQGAVTVQAKAFHPQPCAWAKAITAALYVLLLLLGQPNSDTITGTVADGATQGSSIGDGS